MDAPKKIYIGEVQATPYGDLAFIDTWLDVPFGGLVENYEYTRTDVFIDKACEWLNGVVYDYMSIRNGNVDTSVYIDDNKFIEDFRKAMGD